MKIISAILVIVFISVETFAQPPQILPGWPYGTRSTNQACLDLPAFSIKGDVNGPAIFFNTNLGDINKFKFDGSFYQGWQTRYDTLIFMFQPILADIDHDGNTEMLTMGRTYGSWHHFYIFAFDDNGLIMPGFPIEVHQPDFWNVSDFDGDDEYEIITDSQDDGLIFCYDRYGQMKSGWPVPLPNDLYSSYAFASSVGDLDQDGKNEIVIDGLKHIYSYRYDGTMQPGFPIVISDTSLGFSVDFIPGSLADFDNDGFLEYAVSAGDWYLNPNNPHCLVALYDHMGRMKEGWPLTFDGSICCGVTPADVNNDGRPELGFENCGESYGGLQFANADGQTLPGYPIFPQSSTETDLICVDVNADRIPEMFFDNNGLYPDSMGHDSLWYYGHSFLNGIDQNGNTLPGLPMQINGGIFFRPPDFAYDSLSHRLYMGLFTDIYLTYPTYLDTANLDIYIWPDSTGRLTEWPMQNHDNLHTRNYNFVDNVTGIHDENEIIPKSFVLKQNYPNPFNGNTVIEFSLPKEESINLSVYDILGRKVREIINNKLKAGNYKENINLSNAASGVYFCVLKGEKTKITRKMMLIK